MIDDTTKSLLFTLADRYEQVAFLDGDPSWFMHQVKGQAEQEVMAFIAASLSYGARRQFMPKIEQILRASAGQPYEWVKSHAFVRDIPPSDDCYYRLYSCRAMNIFLRRLADMLDAYGTIGGFIQSVAADGRITALYAIEELCRWFAQAPNPVIPKDTKSACKRLCMFLRWMVRDSSPVDLGLWTDIIDKRTLIIPMDTHVLQEAVRLGLANSRTATMSAARRLTASLAEVWPDDPVRGDFALFGLGVSDQ